MDRAGSDIIPVTSIVFNKLASALERVCKNPRNPGFNHNLFESIAILVKNVCAKNPSQVGDLEAMLFPPFNTILQMDILEFTPYVFQILSQLLEFRPDGLGLGDSYTALFPPLLHASLWEKSGNVPGLTRLLQAYLKQAGPELVSWGHLTPMLGIWQKLNSAKATESSGFELISSLTQYVPHESLEPSLFTVLQLILTRLQGTKSNLYPIRSSQYFALFCGLYGGQKFVELLNKMQRGLALMLLANSWLPKLQGASSNKLQAKIQVIGLTRFLSDAAGLLNDDNGKQVVAQVVLGIVSVLTSSSFTKEEKDLPEETVMVYDATFSQLRYAQKVPDDPFGNIGDPADFFLGSLKTMGATHPGVLGPVIQAGLGSDPKLATSFQSMCAAKGIQLL
jgi:exportin-2 (importin alpha re-exporter)